MHLDANLQYLGVVGTSAWEVFRHIQSVKILVILNPTGYMLDIFGDCFHSFEINIFHYRFL